MDEVIEISSRSQSPDIDRREILKPAISQVVHALGGLETVPGSSEPTYVLGDSCLGCLRDLKKFWRKDDTDDDRTVARIFWETRVLNNDLVPILLETAGKGKVEDKCAIACADLITAMTWPIDLAEELRELDEEPETIGEYTTLIQAQRSYKSALLTPGVLKALFDMMLPPLAKDKKERKGRDGQIISVILHAFRNLAFIKDPPSNTFASSDQAEFSSLQSKFLLTLQKDHILTLFLTLASNADEPSFNQWNALLLEIFYLLFRSVKPQVAVLDPKKQPRENLMKLLDAEDKLKREEKRKAASRHSRFGTTISIKSGTDQYILHRQQALTAEPSKVMDMAKKSVTKRLKKQDDLGSLSDLTPDAVQVLQTVAKEFLITCFNPFLSSLLKDIKAERPKITEKDNLRLLFVTKWFLEFFLALRAKEQEVIQDALKTGDIVEEKWGFGRVTEVVEKAWAAWMLRRMRGALDDKPKQWTELQSGIECLTQLLCLIDHMSLPTSGEAFNEASQTLQYQLYYDGEILELSFEMLKGYKEQSIAYLDSSVYLAYVLLKMLEKWGKNKGEMYVRKRKTGKNRGRKGDDGHGVNGDVPSDEDPDKHDDSGDDMFNEHMFTFEKFEAKFAQSDITHACLVYLARYKDFDSPEQMKRVVGLLHRQAVKAKAEGLFFRVSTLDLFNRILSEQKILPRDQPYKDLISLINFILRKFFKNIAESPFLIVEAFWPKNRNQWKQYSTWDEEERARKELKDKNKAEALAAKRSQEVDVKGAYSEKGKISIVVACLVDEGRSDLVDWVQNILWLVKELRQGIINKVDGPSTEEEPLFHPDDLEDEAGQNNKEKIPSNDALQKFEDYVIPYTDESRAEAATKNAQLKLLFRLVNFFVKDSDADEFEWYIPAAILPAELQKSLESVKDAVSNPIDLEGQKPSSLLRKKAARRPRRAATPSSSSESGSESEAALSYGEGDSRPRSKKHKSKRKKAKHRDDDGETSKRRTKKKKEAATYKSAKYIDDSDLDDDEEFFRKEKEIRERALLAAAEGGGGNMMATGVKKRKGATAKVGQETDASSDERDGRKKRKSEAEIDRSDGEAEGGGEDEVGARREKRLRPKPRPRAPPAVQGTEARMSSPATGVSSPSNELETLAPWVTNPSNKDDGSDAEFDMATTQTKRKTKRFVVSDDDDD